MATVPTMELVESIPQIQQRFAHTVGMITSQGLGTRPNIMACEWTIVVSWDPIMIMVVIGNGDMTNELIRESGEFGVNILPRTRDRCELRGQPARPRA